MTDSDLHPIDVAEERPAPPHPIFATAAIGFLLTDLNGVITYANPFAESLYGRSLVNEGLTKLASPYSRPDQDRALRTALNGGNFDSTLEHIVHDNQHEAVHIVMSPAHDESGNFIGVSCFIQNVQQIVQIQRGLQHERDQFEALIESATDAFLMLDEGGTVVLVNSACARLFNVARFALVGRPIGLAVRELHDLPQDLTGLLISLGQDHYQTMADTFEIKSTERRVLNWYTAPVYTGEGTLMGRSFTFRDVTAEREADRAKTEFVSMVSHELRTPLTSVRGYADYILDGDAGPVNAEVLECVHIIKSNAERLTSLINDILDLTRIEAGRIELRPNWCSLEGVIHSVLASMQPMIAKKHQAVMQYVDPELPQVWIDQNRITQVLTNLISNASKYTHERGTLIIETGMVYGPEDMPKGPPEEIEFPCVLVTVQDTGVGISEEAIGHVFERFYRSEDAQRRQIQGSGLGLTIARSFVELHKGRIWIQSELNMGTAIYFTIPATKRH